MDNYGNNKQLNAMFATVNKNVIISLRNAGGFGVLIVGFLI